jgi:hypothetical protein
MRVAGAAQDSGGGIAVDPVVELKITGASGASVPERESPENREVVETTRREP